MNAFFSFDLLRLFKRLTRKTAVYIICIMKPCNITSMSLIIARFSGSKKNYSADISYLRVLFHSS
jgi:hypothetical protein